MPDGFATFPDDYPLQPYTVLLGFATGPDARVHAFATYASISGQSGYQQALCGAFWQFVEAPALAALSVDEAAYLALASADRCADCRTQYQRLRASEIAPPAVSQPAALAAVSPPAEPSSDGGGS